MRVGIMGSREDGFRSIVSAAGRDLAASWRQLAMADLAWKALAFAVFTPAVALLGRWLLSRTGASFVADADIARFFFTTLPGVTALIVGGAIACAISVVEAGSLMVIGAGTVRGQPVGARSAIGYAARRAGLAFRLAVHMVVRAILGILPFVVALGLIYAVFLRGHDINYFLSRKPPVFWVAAVLGGAVVVTLAVVIVWTATRWALSLPLVLFEGVAPRRALAESSLRSKGNRVLIAVTLLTWAVAAIALGALVQVVVETLARAGASSLAGSPSLLVGFLVAVMIFWALLALAAGIFSFSMFALLLVRIWIRTGSPSSGHVSQAEVEGEARAWMSRGGRRFVFATAILLVAAFALIAFMATRAGDRTLVIAHRGASLAAPENTLAAFRLAATEGADYIELDVQESLDGEVMVVHDHDLMKVGGSPMKIEEHTAAELRSVDIGSFAGPKFAAERVPTLTEALQAVPKPARVMIELKSYGHSRRLEEKVVEVVEAAGMQDRCAYMSLDHDMVRTMKRLRPQWTVGALVAKAIGDPTKLGADFLAVESRTATPRFVRRAHRAGQRVYVWTVNDPGAMLAQMSRGVDGLITDRPAVGRKVVSTHSGMSDAQRLAVAFLLRTGVDPGTLNEASALRP
jgi:glycerophosphoryl diester phosphodiesterase